MSCTGREVCILSLGVQEVLWMQTVRFSVGRLISAEPSVVVGSASFKLWPMRQKDALSEIISQCAYSWPFVYALTWAIISQTDKFTSSFRGCCVITLNSKWAPTVSFDMAAVDVLSNYVAATAITVWIKMHFMSARDNEPSWNSLLILSVMNLTVVLFFFSFPSSCLKGVERCLCLEWCDQLV